MFHDSGRRVKNMPSDLTSRICLHCGYAYGEHYGNDCPEQEDTIEWRRLYPVINRIFYICHFCKQEFNVTRNDKSGFYMVGKKTATRNNRKQAPVCNDCEVAGKRRS